LRADLARFSDALPPDPRVPDFILQVQDAANAAGIDFLTITPSLPTAAAGTALATAPATGTAGATATPAPTTGSAPAPATPGAGLKEISVAMTTTGQFFEVEDFINRLEHLARALKIEDFSLSITNDTSGGSALSVSLKLKMFTMTAAAPVPAPAAPTTGAA
jgi:Tfp pilus assembly protein PilO